MKTNEATTKQETCQERLYNGLTCGRPATGTVALDFTDERKPVCPRHGGPKR